MAHQTLEESIEDEFDRFEDAKARYENSHTFEDYIDCVNILPQIADLVTCLRIESLKADGKFPIN